MLLLKLELLPDSHGWEVGMILKKVEMPLQLGTSSCILRSNVLKYRAFLQGSVNNVLKCISYHCFILWYSVKIMFQWWACELCVHPTFMNFVHWFCTRNNVKFYRLPSARVHKLVWWIKLCPCARNIRTRSLKGCLTVWYWACFV